MTTDIEAPKSILDYFKEQAAIEKQTDPRVLEAWNLQEEISRGEKALAEKKNRLQELVRSIGQYDNGHYSVTDLKPRRIIDMQLIRENFPDIFESATPSDKYLLAALEKEFGKDTLLTVARNQNPEDYDAHREITLAEFDARTKDNSKKRLHEGKAYHLKWLPSKDTHVERISKPLMMTAPSRYAALDDREEDEE